jgi:hypothetical protein
MALFDISGSPELVLLEMSITNNYSNAYVGWQFT